MLRSVASKVMWVGRATTFCMGLAVVLAVVLGVGGTALAAVPGDPFKLGRINYVDQLTALTSVLGGPVLRVDNDGSGTALELRVGDPTVAPATKPVAPMKVDSQAKVTNLNSDELDGKSAPDFLPAGGKAADAETLDGLDSTQFMGNFSGRYVATNSVSSSAQLKSAYVQCPSGERAVDGGANLVHNGDTVSNFAPLALQSVGSVGDDAWRAIAAEMAPYEGDWSISLNVLCVPYSPCCLEGQFSEARLQDIA